MRELLLPSGHRNILLSPHHDDIAFSLGNAVAEARSGVLLNLFTLSANRDGERLPVPPPADRVARVTAERCAEDEEFAARMGLDRLDLALPEPALLGRGYRNEAGIAADVAALQQSLLPALRGLFAVPGPIAVFCPAGIGRHVNHVATRSVLIEALPELEARGVRVMFYEDLPYASRLRQRLKGLAALRRALSGRRLARRTCRVQRSQKLELINLYPSQLRLPATVLRRFSPAALWPIGPHEAVWELLPS